MKHLHSLGVAACTLIAAYAGSAAAAEPGLSADEIHLGMVNAQTGGAAGLGLGMREGAESVFAAINAKGGVHGRKLKLSVDDDAYDPNRAIDGTLKMIEEQQVFALFGYVGTPTANAVLPIVKETHVPLIGLFTGAMTLRQPVTPEIINVRASYDDETDKLVDYFIKEKHAKTFAMFYQDDGFGQAVLSGTLKALKKHNLDIVAKGTFERGTTAVKSGLAAILPAQPDVVMMAGPYTPLAAFIKEARTQGLKSELATVSFVGTDNLVNEVGSAGNGVVISQVVPFPGDLSIPIVKDCAALLGQYAPGKTLGYVNLEGCISAKTLIAGLDKAGTELTRTGLIGAFEQLHGMDLGGFTLSFSASNHQASDVVFLSRIADGHITALDTGAR